MASSTGAAGWSAAFVTPDQYRDSRRVALRRQRLTAAFIYHASIVLIGLVLAVTSHIFRTSSLFDAGAIIIFLHIVSFRLFDGLSLSFQQWRVKQFTCYVCELTFQLANHWKCSCGYLAERHLFSRCAQCGKGFAFAGCPRCGTSHLICGSALHEKSDEDESSSNQARAEYRERGKNMASSCNSRAAIYSL